jgi:glutamyl-tRNA reductase
VTILVIGLNHRTAPVALRENLALAGCDLPAALQDLRAHTSQPPASIIDEAVILSTCNRLEVWLSSSNTGSAIRLVTPFLARQQGIAGAAAEPHVYHLAGDEAIRHLMRVACGLESMILGESQILGQITKAFEAAQQAGMTRAVLSHLFAQAAHAGKRARAETAISRYTTSVSHTGAALITQKLSQPAAARVLLIGAGETAALAAQALRRFGVRHLAFINRSLGRAEALAADFGGKALAWPQLAHGLAWADAVICATGAPHTVLLRRDIEAVLGQRQGRPLTIMDIAVPRDAEASIRELPGVEYDDIDALQAIVDAHVELRLAAVPQVEAIIEQEMARFVEWYRGRQVAPVITTLRAWAQSIADEELTRTLNRLSDTDEHTQQVVSHMAHRLINRLLHEPTTRLRLEASAGRGGDYAQAVRALFGLDEEAESSGAAADQPAGALLAGIRHQP